MNRSTRRTLMLVVAALIGTGGAGGHIAARADDAADIPSHLAAIRTQLVSDDFNLREKGRAELGKIPPSAIETLRAAEKSESDEEVRARLRARITEMELYILVHPPALTLANDDYTLAEVAASLNKQLGTEGVFVSGDARKFSLNADQQPFWEIFRQLYIQEPVNISTMAIRSPKGSVDYRFRITPIILNGNPQTLTVSDTFGILTPKKAQSTPDGWSIRPTILSDPRIRISQFSTSIQVDQITSQKGESLLGVVLPSSAALSSSSGPVGSFTPSINLRNATNVTGIKEIRGHVTLMVVESERTISFDLTKDKHEPVKTGLGTFTLQTDAGGNRTLTLDTQSAEGPRVVGANLPILNIQFRDKRGDTVREVSVRATSIPITQLLNLGGGGMIAPADISSMEFTLVDKAREYVLPILLKDIELPLQMPATDQQLPGRILR